MSTIKRFRMGGLEIGWGEGVPVRSAADLDAVRELIGDRHVERGAVVFSNLTARQRRPLVRSIEQLGVELREFTKDDRKATSVRLPTLASRVAMRGYVVLCAPFVFANRLRGRTHKRYKITPITSPDQPSRA